MGAHAPLPSNSPVSNELLSVICAAGAVLGHVFTVFFDFEGGKAVSTSVGVVMALSFMCAMKTMVWFIATLLLLKVSTGRGYSACIGMCSVSGALALPIIHLRVVEDGPAAAIAVLTTSQASRGGAGGSASVAWFVLGIALMVVVRHVPNIRQFLNDPKDGSAGKKN